MNLSKRTKLSLCQLLLTISRDALELLIEKYGAEHGLLRQSHVSPTDALKEWLLNSNDEVSSLLNELACTSEAIRAQISPRYIFDQRWKNLCSCLELDGYQIDNQRIVSIDHQLDGVRPPESLLFEELSGNEILDLEEVAQKIESSAEKYLRSDPDYNGCLSDARIALETLAKMIAIHRSQSIAGPFNPERWGEVISYLRVSGLITVGEEQALAGTYKLISPGSHRPVGFSEVEFVRLGRHIAMEMTYFLMKRFKGDVT